MEKASDNPEAKAAEQEASREEPHPRKTLKNRRKARGSAALPVQEENGPESRIGNSSQKTEKI